MERIAYARVDKRHCEAYTAGRMSTLSSAALRGALDALHAIGESCAASGDFARRGLECLPRLVSADLTTLSVCDLEDGRRRVVSDRPGAVSARQVEVFDHYFHQHPLVREHGRKPGAVTRRIADLLPEREFRRTPLYNDYYRSIGLDQVMAVPIHVDRRLLVSFVFNRGGRGFSERERDCLELIRPHLGSLYRLSAVAGRPDCAPRAAWRLTMREQEVLRWLSAGKTDKDIGAILGISRRTVHKHLQRIYDKLGVETRTAAVVRLMGRAAPERM
jgi:DNA-binding CsgD family transcriptional regulator